MDVLCVGMYRACSTWQYEVIAHLLERHRDGRRLGYLTGDQYAALGPAEPGAWRVLKSHEEHGSFARALAQGRAVAVYAHRDIRDVVYSLMHKRQASFDDILRAGMIHQILANDRFWSGRPGSITQRYDRLIAEPAAGVAELAAHLGLDLAPGEADRVAAEYSFQANRKRAEDLGRKLQDGGIDLADPAIAQAHDHRTLLHWNHLREGRVGDWRGRATPRERAVLDRICGRWLMAHGYEPDDTAGLAGVGPAGAIARGALACRLRTLSLRYPRTARVAKRILGIAPDAPLAPKAPIPDGARRDDAEGPAVPPPHAGAGAVSRPR
ncbi:sulfotransferase domain-containing protein [Tundrisphaera sp. TA3]|uniref:sulfotransferase domain-containing protein n=1 Tax=Tundrisphaera sp. TA3 TaxID=3435775 RepID=UPI003EB72845